MKKTLLLTASIVQFILFVPCLSFANDDTDSCSFKVKNSTGDRVRVCEYNSDDDTNAFGHHDKVLNDGDSAWFDCVTSTCNLRVQWYWDGGDGRGIIDSCATGYRKTYYSSSTSALKSCNNIEIFLKSGNTDRKTDDAVWLSVW